MKNKLRLTERNLISLIKKIISEQTPEEIAAQYGRDVNLNLLPNYATAQPAAQPTTQPGTQPGTQSGTQPGTQPIAIQLETQPSQQTNNINDYLQDFSGNLINTITDTIVNEIIYGFDASNNITDTNFPTFYFTYRR